MGAKDWIAVAAAVVALGSVVYSAGYQGAQVTALQERVEKLESKADSRAESVARLEERLDAARRLLENIALGK